MMPEWMDYSPKVKEARAALLEALKDFERAGGTVNSVQLANAIEDVIAAAIERTFDRMRSGGPGDQLA